MLWHLNEVFLLLATAAFLLAATEAGFRLGRNHANREDESVGSYVQAMQASVLGLLALLLGFTFFMAASRFDLRKSLLLEEANAIGTVFLRSQLLHPEHRKAAKLLLGAHVKARLAFHAAGTDPDGLEKANAEAARIEQQLWSLAIDAAAPDSRSVPVGLFIESLNAVIDLHEKRQVAFENHVPEPVLYLLLVVSAASSALLGYGCGLVRRRRFGLNTLFALLIVLVVIMTLDMDRPSRGVITVPQDSLVRLLQTLERNPE